MVLAFRRSEPLPTTTSGASSQPTPEQYARYRQILSDLNDLLRNDPASLKIVAVVLEEIQRAS